MSLDVRTQKLAKTVFAAAQEIKAKDVIALDLSDVESYTDFILIASGGSERQLSAIADNILKRVFEELGMHPIGIEGRGSSDWVLIDFGSVIVHLFFEETRNFYHLEDMWLQVKPIPETKIDSVLSDVKSKVVRKTTAGAPKKVLRSKVTASKSTKKSKVIALPKKKTAQSTPSTRVTSGSRRKKS